MAIGMAATHPVRLNNAKAAMVMRVIIDGDPFQNEAHDPEVFRQSWSRLWKVLATSRFSKASWEDWNLRVRQLANH